ncbi:hypothetical protein ACFL14_01635 [Patescibacteria group bacterium]
MQILLVVLAVIVAAIILAALVYWFHNRNSLGIFLPVYEKLRYPCPFYGFYSSYGAFMDQDGNQCPLIGGYSPCRMKMAGKKPNWEECTVFNTIDNKSMISALIGQSTIFPDEFHPTGLKEWYGVPFSEWWDYIMDSDTPRPPDPNLN